MKNISINILCFVLPFIVGCSTVNANTPAKTWGQAMNKKVETFSQLDSSEPSERPRWLSVAPQSKDGFYFVGMSTKRTEKRDARNESFNDALIGFARFCGLNVQYLAEHRDRSVGGNGGLIDTWTDGNTIAKMQAEMHLGNVTTEDRYTEKYSSFYGGSFMGHTYVDATLIKVPKTEMELCRENRKQANTFLAQKTKKIEQLEAKNESLENQLVVEKQNTSVALSQAHNSSNFFKQVLGEKTPEAKKTVAKTSPIVKTIVKTNPKTSTPLIIKDANGLSANSCKTIKDLFKAIAVCDGLIGYYPFTGDATDKSGNGYDGTVIGANPAHDRGGYPGHSYKFDGNDDYIQFNNRQFEFGKSSFSISVIGIFNNISNEWTTNSQKTVTYSRGAISHSDEKSSFWLGYNFYKNGGNTLFFSVREGSNSWAEVTSTKINPLEYNVYTGVADKNNNTVTFYVNGELIGSSPWNGNVFKYTNKWYLGVIDPTRNNTRGNLNGQIDEVRIYNRALNSDEVKTLYQSAGGNGLASL